MNAKKWRRTAAENIFDFITVYMPGLDQIAVHRDEEAIIACLEDFINLVHHKYRMRKNGNKN